MIAAMTLGSVMYLFFMHYFYINLLGVPIRLLCSKTDVSDISHELADPAAWALLGVSKETLQQFVTQQLMVS